MGPLLDAFKTLKVWQMAVLVAVLAGAAGATFGVYALVSDENAPGLSEGQQLIPVRYGDLIDQVSVNGGLIFPNRETLKFATQGTVDEVLVMEGQPVEVGQEVASLDQITVAFLEKTAAQARINLQHAEDALAKARDPHTTLDMAEAEANVANARLSVKSALDALDRLLKPTAQDVAQAEAAVANARLSLRDAQDALDKLVAPTALDIAQAEAAVANTRLSLRDAQDALDKLVAPTALDVAQAEAVVTGARLSAQDAQEALEAITSGPGDDDIAKNQSQVDSANTVLANARRDLKLAQKEWDDKLGDAQDDLDAVLQDYRDVFRKWLGIDLTEGEEGLDPEILLDSWGVDLNALFDPQQRYYDMGKWTATQGPTPDASATKWSEATVYAWQNLSPIPVVSTCDDTASGLYTLCITREMDDAWSAYQEANDNLDTVDTQAAKAIASAEDAVPRALESLADAEQALNDLTAAPDSLETESVERQLALALATLQQAEHDLNLLKTAPDSQAGLDSVEEGPGEAQPLLNALEAEAQRKQVAVAQANLDKAVEDLSVLTDQPNAQARLDSAEEGLGEAQLLPNALEVEAQGKEVAVALANLDKALEDLSVLTDQPDAQEVEAQRKQVAVAQANLEEAEEELEELIGSADPLEVALREADVASARLALDTALQRREGATIVAPIAGFVSLVNVEAGEVVNANTVVLEIVDPTVVEVDGIVDEIDVLFVREGAQSAIIMDALPGGVLDGVVSTIGSAAQNQQGVVSYSIRIQVRVPEGVQLREGLSATASIVIREDNDVLLVPNQAIYGTFEEPLVRVMNIGGIEERPVVLGNSDEFWTVVTEGLQEGDQVVIETAEATADPFAGFRQQREAGGFPGGGFGGQGRGFGGGGQRQR